MLRTQLFLPGLDFKRKLSFGGKMKGHPKGPRPVVCRDGAMHLILKSEQASEGRLLLKNKRVVENVLQKQGQKFRVILFDQAIAGNHLHLLVRVPTRRALADFLRACAGLIAAFILKKHGGKKSFWELRPFSRVVHLGRDFLQVKNYLALNRLEVENGWSRTFARDFLALSPQSNP